ncbi:hypothetical protein [Streptomyces venetus]
MGAVVLPMRFGSASPNGETVTTVLTERAHHFRRRSGSGR